MKLLDNFRPSFLYPPMLTDLEKKIIAAVQGDLPVTPRPYRAIAEKIGIPEDVLLDIVSGFAERGVMRRFGATLRHQKSGFGANAMGAWQVEENRIEEVGRTMASFPEVSHCYQRPTTPEWPFNLYTMIHATDETTCRETAERMSKKAKVSRYSLLFSREELKKTSMVYFPDTAKT
jgi:DNA-binding Lrp family transcriptional regulator